MKNDVLRSMSTEELWSLYEQVSTTLAREIAAEKTRLKERLRKIETASNVMKLDRVHRAYPKVLPKYRNPQNKAETWSGRGKQPRWLTAQLRSGKRLNSFLIPIERVAVKPAKRTAFVNPVSGHRAFGRSARPPVHRSFADAQGSCPRFVILAAPSGPGQEQSSRQRANIRNNNPPH